MISFVKVFPKQAGIDMLSPSAGIPYIRKELTFNDTGVEIVVAQSLGMMLNEFDVTGGLDTDKNSVLNILIKDSDNLMVHNIEGMGLHTGFTARAHFDPKEQGFLYDHEINDTPVLPGVMGVEAMVSAARFMFPEMHVKEVSDVAFLAPFKFYRSEPRDVFVKVQFGEINNDILADCTLIGKRRLLGQDTEEVKVHFNAKVILTNNPVKAPKARKGKLTPKKGAKIVDSKDIYKLYFHGPAYQVIDKSWKMKNEVVGLFAEGLNTLPRLLELGFQTAGIMEMGVHNRMGLPSHIDVLQVYKGQDDLKGQLYAVVDQIEDGYNISIVNDKGDIFIFLKGYKTAEFMMNMDEELTAPLEEVLV